VISIGNLLIQDEAPITSSFDRWKCYHSTSKSGSFSVVNGATGQEVKDLSFYHTPGTVNSWYKTSYFNNSSEDETVLTDAFQPQNEKYTSIRKVQKLMRLPTITDTTVPTVQEVAELIKRMQDKIDYVTGHAWRKRYSGTMSGDEQTGRAEFADLDNHYEYRTGRPVYLKHRFIYDMDATEGDKLEVWAGNVYEDWLATRTEGRGEDFFFEYDRGILYINARWGISRPLGIRVTYRYGERAVNAIVENVCSKMVFIDLLYGDSRDAVVPEGGNAALSHGRKIDLMQKEIDEDLSRLKEFPIMNMMR